MKSHLLLPAMSASQETGKKQGRVHILKKNMSELRGCTLARGTYVLKVLPLGSPTRFPSIFSLRTTIKVGSALRCWQWMRNLPEIIATTQSGVFAQEYKDDPRFHFFSPKYKRKKTIIRKKQNWTVAPTFGNENQEQKALSLSGLWKMC